MNHWPKLAQLPVVVDACEHGRLDPGEGFGEAHPTRTVRLTGDGREGTGEDITLFLGGDAPELGLVGEWTLGSLSAHLDEVEQWPDGEPEWAMARRWRNWAYESAALDLALTQAGRSLHDVLGLEPRPVSYVNSFGMGDTGAVVVEKVLQRLERYPRLRFKLDAHTSWTDADVAALARTGAVHTVDFKGQYGLEVEDPEALLPLYERVLGGLPDVLLEDPHDVPEVTALLEPHAAERVSYDAPIHTVATLDEVPLAARTFNIKPTRIGRLRDLFALYDACERRGFATYGGGMGELGAGRGQIQLLAAMFSPDAANDIAPPGFNALEPAAGLALSPLDPDPAPVGFRRAS